MKDQPRKPNPAVLNSWRSTRREFESEQARQREAAEQRVHDAATREAVAAAYESWPAIPVASKSERRLRARYLAHIERTGKDMSVSKFLEERSRRSAVIAYVIAFTIASTASIVSTIAAPLATSATISWSVTQVLLWMVGLLWLVAAPVALVSDAVYSVRLDRIKRNRDAYFAWLDDMS